MISGVNRIEGVNSYLEAMSIRGMYRVQPVSPVYETSERKGKYHQGRLPPELTNDEVSAIVDVMRRTPSAVKPIGVYIDTLM